jgi:putative SOS response-associated peptidase YedK
MCNLYSMTTTKEATRQFPLAFDDRGVNMPALPGIYPDYSAPIIRNNAGSGQIIRGERAMARWGMPSPRSALEGKRTDPGVTNVRNTKSSHWRRWLDVENRCVVPFTSFSELNRSRTAVDHPLGSLSTKAARSPSSPASGCRNGSPSAS